MIETLITEWATTAIVNAPVLVFMGIAIWDLRRSLKDAQTRNDVLVERLIEAVSDDEDKDDSPRS